MVTVSNGGEVFAAIAEKFERAEDALRELLAPGKGALKAKEELAAARAALERAGAEARSEMAACRADTGRRLDAAMSDVEDSRRKAIGGLTARIEKSEAAAAALAQSAQAALERSKRAINDVASQARQQSRALTAIARDLKDAAAMLNDFRPDKMTARLDAISIDATRRTRHAGNSCAAFAVCVGSLLRGCFWRSLRRTSGP